MGVARDGLHGLPDQLGLDQLGHGLNARLVDLPHVQRVPNDQDGPHRCHHEGWRLNRHDRTHPTAPDLERQRKIQAYLDRGMGDCHLRDPVLAEMVQGNLWHHDGVKYRLLAWVIMPNHVHALVEIWQVPMGKILQSWKSYTSKEANRKLARTGTFWAEDYFDRYIRDEDHFRRVVRYIENNPVQARLVRTPEEWPWSSARYRSKDDLSARTLTHPGAERIPPPPV